MATMSWKVHRKPKKTALPRLTVENAGDFVQVAAGAFEPSKLSIFSIFRDEAYFCRAYFSHYRNLGVEQFLILDDGSVDGTLEFLSSQPDCVVLQSSLSFGQEVAYTFVDGRSRVVRAGLAFKSLIPYLFFSGNFGLYADADEFLMLPPNVTSLHSVLERLDRSGDKAVVGPMVEFFPRKLPPQWREGSSAPANVADLLRDSPYFEPDPLIKLFADGRYALDGRTKSEELFSRFGVRRVWSWPIAPRPRSPKRKVPIVKHGPDSYRRGSHQVNVRVSPDIMLPFAHFVFTQNFFGKVERAERWRSHAQNAAKYVYYKQLIRRIREQDGELATAKSCRFTGPEDLIRAGLMKWPETGGT